MKLLLKCILAPLVIYMTFVFGTASLDITTWSQDARGFCSLFMVMSIVSVLMFDYLEPR